MFLDYYSVIPFQHINQHHYAVSCGSTIKCWASKTFGYISWSIFASTPQCTCKYLLSILSAKSSPYIPAVHVLLDVLICPIKGLGKGNGCFGECLLCFHKEWKLSFSESEQSSHVLYVWAMSCCRWVPVNICSTYRHLFLLGFIIKIHQSYSPCSCLCYRAVAGLLVLFCHANSQPCSCV